MTPLTSGPQMAKAKQRILLRAAAKAALVLLLDFVLVRIVGPDLINLHNDGALALALLIYAAALAAALWLAMQLWSDRARYSEVDARIG